VSWLIDGSVLISSAIATHPLHARARSWMQGLGQPFFTCAVTEGTFLRMHMQFAADHTASAAWLALRKIQQSPLHVFLDDGFSYTQVDSHPIQGHRQVTDAWLAELARRHGARLATLDAGLATTHGDVAVLIP
jgi:uncharacterized protein